MNTIYSEQDLNILAESWKLTYQLQLPTNPYIVVAGAFEGKLINLLVEMYPNYKRVVGYEPQRDAFNKCVARVGKFPRVDLLNYGLYWEHGARTIELGEYGTDACSPLTKDRVMGTGLFLNAAIELSDRDIDLFVMNMEGSEYYLLPYLLRTGVMSMIKQICVQFHTQYKTADAQETLDALDRKYRRIVDDGPSWIYWG